MLSLDAQVILLVLSCTGSVFIMDIPNFFFLNVVENWQAI